MHLNLSEAINLADAIRSGLKGLEGKDVALCPPCLYLSAVSEILKGSGIYLGAQNGYSQLQGAFTGEVSFTMLKDAGCAFVIIGHSERRQLFNENNDFINKKIKSALSAGLNPILCVGETLEERQANTTERVIRQQIESGLDDIGTDGFLNIIVAYEPVWAIGTGKNSAPEQVQDVHSFIRKLLVHLGGDAVARKVRIIYGGSVNSDNVAALSAQDDIDGALVGGASLKPESFVKIVMGVNKI